MTRAHVLSCLYVMGKYRFTYKYLTDMTLVDFRIVCQGIEGLTFHRFRFILFN